MWFLDSSSPGLCSFREAPPTGRSKLRPQDVLATSTNSMDVEYAVSIRTEISCKNTVKCSENVIEAIRLKPAAKPLCIPRTAVYEVWILEEKTF